MYTTCWGGTKLTTNILLCNNCYYNHTCKAFLNRMLVAIRPRAPRGMLFSLEVTISTLPFSTEDGSIIKEN